MVLPFGSTDFNTITSSAKTGGNPPDRWVTAPVWNPGFAVGQHMTPIEDYSSVEEFVDKNQEMLEHVLRHSNNAYARACAWALIDAGSDTPDLDQLQRELEAVKEMA